MEHKCPTVVVCHRAKTERLTNTTRWNCDLNDKNWKISSIHWEDESPFPEFKEIKFNTNTFYATLEPKTPYKPSTLSSCLALGIIFVSVWCLSQLLSCINIDFGDFCAGMTFLSLLNIFDNQDSNWSSQCNVGSNLDD